MPEKIFTQSDLAILGGEPAFASPLHVGLPTVGDKARFFERVEDAFDRRWLANDGPYVLELETKIAERVGVEHCVALANGTIALELVLRALGLEGEVIVPSFTFVATPHAVFAAGLTPIFADVDRETHMLDAEAVERVITPRTSAILGVHLWGDSCDVDALAAVADRHGLPLLFDAAHGFGCERGGRPIGSFGVAEMFSLHATKIFHSFEGGVITTNDGDLARDLRFKRNFGFAGYDQVVRHGTNAKLNEIAAAMGITSLEALEKHVGMNERAHVQYADELKGIPGIKIRTIAEANRSNYQYVVVTVDDSAPLTRDELRDVLWAENVLCRRYFYPGCHHCAPYEGRAEYTPAPLPNTEALSRAILVLPSGTAATASQISGVCSIIRSAVDQADAVRSRLRER